MLLYRGAAPGSYWEINDARQTGFTVRGALRSNQPPDLSAMVTHISGTTKFSPFVSLSRSLLVAQDYCRIGGEDALSQARPGHIYTIDTTLMALGNLIDPVYLLIAEEQRIDDRTLANLTHRGPQELLGWVANNIATLNALLPSWSARYPRDFNVQTIAVSESFKALVWALRDSELLAYGGIPASAIVGRDSYSW
jgi:hypothetical protein